MYSLGGPFFLSAAAFLPSRGAPRRRRKRPGSLGCQGDLYVPTQGRRAPSIAFFMPASGAVKLHKTPVRNAAQTLPRHYLGAAGLAGFLPSKALLARPPSRPPIYIIIISGPPESGPASPSLQRPLCAYLVTQGIHETLFMSTSMITP